MAGALMSSAIRNEILMVHSTVVSGGALRHDQEGGEADDVNGNELDHDLTCCSAAQRNVTG
jgi:hypothetical protein